MSTRRRSIHVDISECDVNEQQRALERILQEKADREYAARLQAEIQRYPPNPPLSPVGSVGNRIIPVIPVRRGSVSSRNGGRRPHLIPRPPTPPRPANRTMEVVDVSDSDSDVDEGESDVSSDESDDEPNNINQAFQDRDAEMYRRELHIYDPEGQATTSAAAAAACRTPEREGVANGRWGDCTLCFEVPKDPKGCNGCLMIIGCKTCINNWHRATPAPSCPLCRRRWGAQPDVSAMTVIERRKRTRIRMKNSSAGTPADPATTAPGTSTSAIRRSTRLRRIPE